MVIAIWSGISKPNLNEYIGFLVAELESVLSNGIFVKNHHVTVEFGRVLCDTPARCHMKGAVVKYFMLKKSILLDLYIDVEFLNDSQFRNHITHFLLIGVVSFNAKHGCQKCTTIGVHCSTYNRVSFPNCDAARRTDDSFRKRIDKDHHKERSLLENLKIDMIAAFPTSDSLHLLDLGITKRCMIRWIFGERGYMQKWSKNTTNNVSKLLETCQRYMPVDIDRAVRNLSCVKKWKGLEYRTILIYIGMVVFKDVLNENEYTHFLTLSCAVRICMTSGYKDYWLIAEQMFKWYVQEYGKLYGKHTIGSNVHLLTHIVDDMKVHEVESLMELSTYKYENSLRLLGLKLRHSNLPLEQVSRRLIEMSQLRLRNDSHSLPRLEKCSPELLYPNQSMLFEAVTYKTIKITHGFILTSKKSNDSWFLTKNNQIVKMQYAKFENDKYLLMGMNIRNKTHLFDKPIDSTRLKIFTSDGILDDELHTYGINDIASKMICLPFEDNFAFIPILHTMESLS